MEYMMTYNAVLKGCASFCRNEQKRKEALVIRKLPRRIILSFLWLARKLLTSLKKTHTFIKEKDKIASFKLLL